MALIRTLAARRDLWQVVVEKSGIRASSCAASPRPGERTGSRA